MYALLGRTTSVVDILCSSVYMYSSGHKKVYVFDYAVAIVRSAVRTVRYYRRTVRLHVHEYLISKQLASVSM